MTEATGIIFEVDLAALSPGPPGYRHRFCCAPHKRPFFITPELEELTEAANSVFEDKSGKCPELIALKQKHMHSSAISHCFNERIAGAWAATGHIHVPRPAGSLRSCKIALHKDVLVPRSAWMRPGAASWRFCRTPVNHCPGARI